VSIRTGMFNPEEAKYANGVVVDLPYPTDDVRLLARLSTLSIMFSGLASTTARPRSCCLISASRASTPMTCSQRLSRAYQQS
jgi:hypothetical protein